MIKSPNFTEVHSFDVEYVRVADGHTIVVAVTANVDFTRDFISHGNVSIPIIDDDLNTMRDIIARVVDHIDLTIKTLKGGG